jgi:selenocysteine lyase/cysteine desulfurase
LDELSNCVRRAVREDGSIATRASPLPATTDFSGAAGFLDTASIGIPPTVVLAEMRTATEAWGRGEANPASYDPWIDRGRDAFARLHGVSPESVSIGPQISYFAGMVAAALPEGAEVVGFAGDFTSVLFPMLARGDLDVRLIDDLAAVPAAVRPSTALVAVSAVQSSDGSVTDLDALREAVDGTGTLTLVDATQASGWLPMDVSAFDFVTVGAYKWLLSPRGCSLMVVSERALDRLEPTAPGWYAGEDPWETLYGGPLRLAADARRFDMSPTWLAWVGTARALEYVEETGVAAIHTHDVGLANRFRAGLGLGPGNSAVVSIDAEPDPAALAQRNLRVATRAGRLRACFHLYNSEADVDSLLEVVGSAGK